MRGSVKAPICGERMTVDWARRVVEELRANRILPGVGYRVYYTRNGTHLFFNGSENIIEEQQTQSLLHPWKVRWMSHDDEDQTKGEWQVYVPTGSLAVNFGNRTVLGKMTNAIAKNGEGEELVDWFKIGNPEDEDAEATFENGGGLKWNVKIRVTPWGEITVTTVNKKDLEVNWLWEDSIAVISVIKYEDESSSEGERLRYIRKINQIVRDSILKQIDTSKAFAINYEETGEGENKSKTAKIINQTMMLGREQVEKSEPTELTDDHESVWVKISHPAEKFSIDVVMEEPGESNDDQTCFKIYDLYKRIVVKDFRDTIPALPFYTNSPDNSNQSGDSNESGDANN